MAESRRTVTYEVHVRRRSRWEIHARFDAAGRHLALARAKAANRHPGIVAVKVVKEIYDPVDGVAREFVVYRSRRRRHPVPASDADRSRRPLLRRGLDQILAAPPAIGGIVVDLFKRVVTSPHWAILPRALIGTAAAFFIATMVTGIVAFGLGGGGAVSSPAADGGPSVLLVVFAGMVVIGALAAALLLTAGFGRAVSGFAWPKGAPTASPRLRPPAVAAARRPPVPHDAPPRPATPCAAGSAALPAPAEELRGLLVGYLRRAIRPARGAYDLADPTIRFGINLFVAGACEGLCRKKDIDTPTTAAIMAAGLRAVGVDPGHAALLAGNYVEHLIADARYMAMFVHGRRAMLDHLAGLASAADMLWRALGDWTLPHPRGNARTLVIVMFTRLIPLADGTAEPDDERNSRLARAQDRIVEPRLIDFGGKRIKHTPSGTLAVFMSGPDAARAAGAIRADVADHARQAADRPLAVAIGLNCGQPIAEGNDLFGTSVQLAARIADIAKAGQILVSPAVRERIAAEVPRATFSPRGPFTLSGFDAAVPLYEPAGL